MEETLVLHGRTVIRKYPEAKIIMTFCQLKEKSITSRVEGLNLFKDLIENYGLGGNG